LAIESKYTDNKVVLLTVNSSIFITILIKTLMTIREIEPWVITFIGATNLWVLRRKKDGAALNVSYSEEGLKWSCNKTGRAIYFQKGYIRGGKLPEGIMSAEVYVERFKPGNKKSQFLQQAECTWIGKALRLMYFQSRDREVGTYASI